MTIFVGNLADEVTEDDLRRVFENFGHVTAVSITKDSFGESKGVAFVEMSDKAEAQAAINGLNGQELKDRALNVDEARSER